MVIAIVSIFLVTAFYVFGKQEKKKCKQIDKFQESKREAQENTTNHNHKGEIDPLTDSIDYPTPLQEIIDLSKDLPVDVIQNTK